MSFLLLVSFHMKTQCIIINGSTYSFFSLFFFFFYIPIPKKKKKCPRRGTSAARVPREIFYGKSIFEYMYIYTLSVESQLKISRSPLRGVIESLKWTFIRLLYLILYII